MPSLLQLRRNDAVDATAAVSAGNGGCNSRNNQNSVRRRVCLTRGMHVPEHVATHHTHEVGPDQCCSAMVQTVDAPLDAVWSVVRRFDNPQAYKHFVRRCRMVAHDNGGGSDLSQFAVGDLREVHVVSGLPAASSVERLEILDEDRHVISFSLVGGDHRLKNYRSVTTLHSRGPGEPTVVIESYVVDIPPGNTEEETLSFVDTIVRCNLQSLAQLSRNMMARNDGDRQISSS